MGVMPSGKQAASAPFTPLHFQLVLLRRMADHNPDLVEDARHTLGVSIADMREANKRWQAMVRSPPRSNELARGHPHRARAAASRYRSVLGAPETVLTRKVGELECEAWLWPVPLWPDLRFEALLAPNGSTVWNEWLVRAPEAEGPDLRTLEDLTPWSCTVDEAARAFPPARPLEGTAPTRWGLTFTAPDQRGAHREVTAEFTWGLLQRLTVR
ncbi:hypothetical protein TUSST3_69510 [Streptomyces sp. TUS-ST3]|uniref:hypothetical protein n=1 Tax=Streptomyces sp. TUS-ST3 TaxID=3025591 RepID=UPI00235B4A1E|nr:hypothetical protein [Streptomyces sp. TUS-ST3]GLP70330.1 hypothetical protein TUSST3_69510 [Streptomyces sp. TUS-ST3]